MNTIEETGTTPADVVVRGNASGFLGGLAYKWREMFQRRRRMRDPLLVFNMSIFNFDDGGIDLHSTQNPRKRHVTVTTAS